MSSAFSRACVFLPSPVPPAVGRTQAVQPEGVNPLVCFLPLASACTDRADGSKLCLFCLQDKLRTGEKAVVCFRFIKHPEYLKIGAKLLFREGVTKGIGHVTDLQAITTKENGLEESLGPGQLNF